MSQRRRILVDGVLTALGVAKRGFFAPYRHAGAVPDAVPPYPAFEAHFAAHEPRFRAALARIEAHAPAFAAALDGPLSGILASRYFGRLDSAALFATIVDARPARIIEVGSGDSTRVMAAAVAAAGINCEIRCIDPAARSPIADLGVTWDRRVLSPEDVGLFAALAPGDIAFFDSSHLLFTGTDVDIILNRILPVLPPGAHAHIHDVFLPDPYPRDWGPRHYTEQPGLGGWILGGLFETAFSSAYVATRMGDALQGAVRGLPEGVWGGASLWLRRSP